MLLEFGFGGDLYAQLRSREQQRFAETEAVFFIASAINGLEVLHNRHILYRDLKPENLILDSAGYLKIADLGLAKKAVRTYTNCGTPDYTAPEVIQGKGNNHSVFWWTLGVLVFELHYGKTPFRGRSKREIYDNILK